MIVFRTQRFMATQGKGLLHGLLFVQQVLDTMSGLPKYSHLAASMCCALPACAECILLSVHGLMVVQDGNYQSQQRPQAAGGNQHRTAANCMSTQDTV